VNTFYYQVDLKIVDAICKENPLSRVHVVPAALEIPHVLDASWFSKFMKTLEHILQGLAWRL
jgi:hypothetical protein